MVNSETHSGSKVANVIVVNSLLLALATIAIAVRLLARGVYLKAMGLDDGQQGSHCELTREHQLIFLFSVLCRRLRR